MNINILKEKDTPLLSRKRITAEVLYGGTTPSKAEIQKSIANLTKVQLGNVEIRHVYTRFGMQKSKIIAHIYEDPNVMSLVVKKGKKQLEKEKKVKAAEKTENAHVKEETEGKK